LFYLLEAQFVATLMKDRVDLRSWIILEGFLFLAAVVRPIEGRTLDVGRGLRSLGRIILIGGFRIVGIIRVLTCAVIFSPGNSLLIVSRS
jgi:hypothetical protein